MGVLSGFHLYPRHCLLAHTMTVLHVKLVSAGPLIFTPSLLTVTPAPDIVSPSPPRLALLRSAPLRELPQPTCGKPHKCLCDNKLHGLGHPQVTRDRLLQKVCAALSSLPSGCGRQRLFAPPTLSGLSGIRRLTRVP